MTDNLDGLAGLAAREAQDAHEPWCNGGRTCTGHAPLDLDAIRKRAEAATPATWRPSPHVDIHEPGYEVYRAPKDGGLYGSEGTVGWAASRADAEFIAHAREDVPALLSEVDRLAQWKAEAMEVLSGWEDVWEALGAPGALGQQKSSAALAEVRQMRRDVEIACGAEASADNWAQRAHAAEAQVQAVRAVIDGRLVAGDIAIRAALDTGSDQ